MLSYRLACLEHLAAMLKARGDWVPLGNADEGKPVQDGTVLALMNDGFYAIDIAADPGSPVVAAAGETLRVRLAALRLGHQFRDVAHHHGRR